MTATDLPRALAGLLVIGLSLGWFYSAWQTLAIDMGRQALFRLRDQWFDLVTSRPEWRELGAARAFRAVLNAQIRWLHKLSLPLVLLLLLVPRMRRGKCQRLVNALVEHLPDGVLRGEARRIQEEAALIVLTTMLKRSLVVWLMAAPLMLMIAVVALFYGATQQTSRMATFRRATLQRLQSISEVEMAIALQEDQVLPGMLRAA